jgi:hypothetical protein
LTGSALPERGVLTLGSSASPLAPRSNNGLSYIGADLTYLNFAVGVAIMFVFFVPTQTWLVKRDRMKTAGQVRSEARFLISLVTVFSFPPSLVWFASNSPGNTSYWHASLTPASLASPTHAGPSRCSRT